MSVHAINIGNIPLEKIQTTCKIVDTFADFTTNFIFQNKHHEAVEAVFNFPLNDGALYYFKVTFNNQVIVSECMANTKVKEVCTKSVDSKNQPIYSIERDPAYVNSYRMRLGRIPRRTNVLITLQYTAMAEVKDAMTESNLVLVFSLPLDLRSHHTTNKSEASKTTFEFDATIKMSEGISAVKSRNYLLRVNDEQNNCKHVTLAQHCTIKGDFDLLIELSKPLESRLIIESGHEELFELMSMYCVMAQFLIDPPEIVDEIRTQIEFFFIFDCSENMDQKSFDLAKSTLHLFVENLPTYCQFQIMKFGNSFELLFPFPMCNADWSVMAAEKYINHCLKTRGRMELIDALKDVLEKLPSRENWQSHVVILSTGYPGNQAETLKLIRDCSPNIRVSTIGFGENVDLYLLREIPRIGRGLASFVIDDSGLATVVNKIVKAISQPVDQMNVEWKLISYESETMFRPVDIFAVPKPINTSCYWNYYLFCGFFKADSLSKLKGAITVHYVICGKQYSIELDIENAIVMQNLFAAQSYPLHRLGGKAQVTDLLQSHNQLISVQQNDLAMKDEKDKLELQITLLSVLFSIVSDFTQLFASVTAPPENVNCFGSMLSCFKKKQSDANKAQNLPKIVISFNENVADGKLEPNQK